MGISQTIYNEDILALTSNATYSLSSVPAIRKLLAADKTALYGGIGQVAAPGAVTVTAVTATSYGVPFLANGQYYALATWVTATGETVAGTATGNATTAGGTQCLFVTAPTSPPAGALYWKCYVSAVGTSTPFFLQSGLVGIGQGFAVGGLGASNALIVTGPNPPTVNTSGTIAGVAGVARYTGITGAAGTFTGTPTVGYGQINYQLGSIGQANPVDPLTGQSLIQFYAASPQNMFIAAMNGVPASWSYSGKLGGIIMATTGGVTTYTLDPSPAAGAAIIRFFEPNEADPLYALGSNGGSMFFQFLETYDQVLNGQVYTAQ